MKSLIYLVKFLFILGEICFNFGEEIFLFKLKTIPYLKHLRQKKRRKASQTVYIGDIVLLELSPRLFDHFAILFATLWLAIVIHIRAVFGPLIFGLQKFTVETFHKAVRIAVIVNARALRLSPAQEKNVELSVAFVDQISSVSSKYSLIKVKLTHKIGMVNKLIGQYLWNYKIYFEYFCKKRDKVK